MPRRIATVTTLEPRPTMQTLISEIPGLPSPPFILVFAPSSRGPSYVSQQQVFALADEAQRQALPRIVQVFTEGDSRDEADVLPDEVAERLCAHFEIRENEFRLLVVNSAGKILRDYDAPAKIEAILEVLDERTSDKT